MEVISHPDIKDVTFFRSQAGGPIEGMFYEDHYFEFGIPKNAETPVIMPDITRAIGAAQAAPEVPLSRQTESKPSRKYERHVEIEQKPQPVLKAAERIMKAAPCADEDPRIYDVRFYSEFGTSAERVRLRDMARVICSFCTISKDCEFYVK